jgi:hypothetical protein
MQVVVAKVVSHAHALSDSPLSCVASANAMGVSTKAAMPAASTAGICICCTFAVPRSIDECMPSMLAAAAVESGSNAAAETERRLPIFSRFRIQRVLRGYRSSD